MIDDAAARYVVDDKPVDIYRPSPGVCCPTCGSTESSVKDSRGILGAVRRRRRCETCGERFTTYEISAADRDLAEMFDTLDRRIRALGPRNFALLQKIVKAMTEESG